MPAAQAQVASLQAQLAAARSDLEARRADLEAWSRRLDAADRAVVDAEREAVLAGPVPAVLDDLRLGIGRPTFAQVRVADADVNASAWCRGCSGGAYLTALIPLVRADPDAYAART